MKRPLTDFKGLPKAAKAFNAFEIMDARQDPEYGYQQVFLLLIKFSNGEYGLCIYDTKSEDFIEEPGTLEAYDQTQAKLKRQFGFDFEN